MRKRAINQVRTDKLEHDIAFYESRGKTEAAHAMRRLARDINAPVSEDEITKLRSAFYKADSESFIPVKSGREVIEERRLDNKTYRLESIKCGKSPCKCEKGRGHGPYWYAYWSEKGKTKSAYIGKELSKAALQSGK